MSNLRRLLRYDLPLHLVLLLTNWLPDLVTVLRLRGALARPFLGSCGANLRIGRNITFYNARSIHIGRDVYIGIGCWFMAGEAPITIGDEVLFAPYCVVVAANHSRAGRSYRYGATKDAPITIGRGAWIAAHVTIAAGTTIGEGTLIAAGAVARGDIPADVIAGGQPARVLREVTDDD